MIFEQLEEPGSLLGKPYGPGPSGPLSKRLLGRSGLSVSALGLGTAALGFPYGLPGSDFGQPQFESAVEIVRRAWTSGINFFDTAPAYGVAEAVVGAALKDSPYAVIASKFVVPTSLDLASGDIAGMLRSSVESSLEALGRGRLDVLQLHSVTEQQLGNDRLLRAVQQLKDEGLLMATGASVYGEAPALASINSGVIDVVQIAFNLLDQRPLDAVFDEAQRKNVGLITRSALLKGALTPRWRALPPPLHELKRAVAYAVAALGIDDQALPEVALRYCLGPFSAVGSVLIGVSSAAELDQAIAVASRGALEQDLHSRCAECAVTNESVLDPWRWPGV